MPFLSIACTDSISENMLEAMGCCAAIATRSSQNRLDTETIDTTKSRPARALNLGRISPNFPSISHYPPTVSSPSSRDPAKNCLNKMHGSTDTRSFIQDGSTTETSLAHVSPKATRSLAVLTKCSLRGQHRKPTAASGPGDTPGRPRLRIPVIQLLTVSGWTIGVH